MRKLFLFFIGIFFFNFVSSVQVEIDCPNSVSVDEEFICHLSASDLSGVYDLKVEVLKDEKTVAKVFVPSEEKWKSAYRYLKEFFDEAEKEIKVIISQEGDYDAAIKLRQGYKTETFPFQITVGESESEEKEESSMKEESKIYEPVETKIAQKELSSAQASIPAKQTTVISLNSVEESFLNESRIVYESKSSRIISYLPYAFSIFLILIILVLLREKF